MNDLYKILFTLLILRISNENEDYYQYIEETALSFFRSHHHTTHATKYGKQLYNYYVKIKHYEKAVETADMFINVP